MRPLCFDGQLHDRNGFLSFLEVFVISGLFENVIYGKRWHKKIYTTYLFIYCLKNLVSKV